MSDFGPRTLKSRLVALGGVALIAGVMLAALWALGVFDSAEGEPAALVDTPGVEGVDEVGARVGQTAPDFEISDFDGGRFRLSDFRGQAVWLNFWATWCEPCKRELPEIQRLQDMYEDELAVIEINRGESTDRAEAFFDGVGRLDGGTGVSFAVDGIDPDETLYDAYNTLPVGGLPISVFIDPRGVVSQVFNGEIHRDQMEEALAGILPPD